jgi:hypothetical protein
MLVAVPMLVSMEDAIANEDIAGHTAIELRKALGATPVLTRWRSARKSWESYFAASRAWTNTLSVATAPGQSYINGRIYLIEPTVTGLRVVGSTAESVVESMLDDRIFFSDQFGAKMEIITTYYDAIHQGYLFSGHVLYALVGPSLIKIVVVSDSESDTGAFDEETALEACRDAPPAPAGKIRNCELWQWERDTKIEIANPTLFRTTGVLRHYKSGEVRPNPGFKPMTYELRDGKIESHPTMPSAK